MNRLPRHYVQDVKKVIVPYIDKDSGEEKKALVGLKVVVMNVQHGLLTTIVKTFRSSSYTISHESHGHKLRLAGTASFLRHIQERYPDCAEHIRQELGI